ncbi:MAG: site-specific DNA-methyltransferase [Planctomycetia bacterium]|nr:site-specific DNA-methyltransferase [Planctomycetia bacterium]
MNDALPTLFYTPLGQALVGDSLAVLSQLPADSVDLVVTSPPFALLRQKSYGNAEQSSYVDWLCEFAPHVQRVLKPTGSYVIDLGGAYERGRPVRALYQFRTLLRHVDQHGFFLAEEFYWHNPSKLPSPIEWVNKRKIRVKDTVNTLWWLSKTEHPKANVSNVLAPYSERMKTLLRDPDKFYTPKDRPSGHQIGKGFARDNGGAIPSNLLQLPNTESNGTYLRLCKQFGVEPHPARFPVGVPEFFIKFLTDEGDSILDIFGGSGTTGEAAERLGRRWMTIDLDRDYVHGSLFRFVGDRSDDAVRSLLVELDEGKIPMVAPQQPGLFDSVAEKHSA